MARRTRTNASSVRRRRPRRTNARKASLLSPDKLKQLYTKMLHCRMIEEEASQLFKETGAARHRRVVGGHEASEVGAIIGLQARDCVAPRRRDLVASFILGAPLKLVLAQIHAHLANPTSPRISARHRPEAPLIIAGAPAMVARLNISTGVALAYRMQKKPGVVVVFSGDDSMSLASWHEAVDFAVAHKLPIVHVVQDDLGGDSANPKRESSTDTSAGDIGMPTLIVDGNDVVAVYRVAQEAIRRAREGHGPTLIACKTHRWPGYSGIAPAQHRPPSGKSDDAIPRMEAYLAQKDLWSEPWKQKLVSAFRKQLDAAVHFARRR